jgi:hypothetical protein
VSALGFAEQVVENVELLVGNLARVDVHLTVAGPKESIVVPWDAATIDPQRTAIATVITAPQLEYLPLNGRNFISMALLTPAVTVDRVPQQGAAAGSGLSFVGQRARANNVTVDGVDNNEASLGSVRATFSQDAIQEFQVVAHSYAAEFGKATGGILNIVTKSGSNRRSGSAFAYLRDEMLNAKEYFERFNPDGTVVDGEKASFARQQVGIALGGPIVRDRAFYFGAFEHFNTDANNFVTIDDSRPMEVFGVTFGTAADLLRRAGFPVRTGHVPYAARSDTALLKVDRQFEKGSILTIRYNFADTHDGNIEPFGGIVAQSRGGALDATDHMFVAAHNTVHDRVVNELRVQIARRDQGVYPLDPSCIGTCNQYDEGGPTVEIAGVASVGRHRFYPQLRKYDRYQVIDTVARVALNHEFKAGVDVGWQDALTSTLPLHYGGRFVFSSLPAVPGLLPAPVSAAQAFALGLPSAYVQGYGEPASAIDAGDLSLFAQDAWRIVPDVTIKAGIRYQTQFWRQTAYDVPGVGRYGFPVDRNDVAPRLAIAWNPSRHPSATLHGAYGMFFDRQVISPATVADIVDGSSHGTRTRVLRFPLSVSAWQEPTRRLVEPSTAYPSLIIAADPGMRTPYAHHVSIGVDRRLLGDYTLSVSGVWVRGFNQLGTLDYNPIVPALGVGRRPLDVNGVAGTSASVLQYTSFGETWYSGLLTSLSKRFNGKSQLLLSYTLSNAEDTSSDFQTSVIAQTNGSGRNPDDPRGLPAGFNPREERGPALHDRRHQFVVSGTYVAPHGLVLSAILTASSGPPFNILAGADLNGDGDGGAFPPDRARRVPSDPTTSLPRNAARLPAQVTVDARASRAVPLIGRTQAELLIEAFNLFNRTNFTDVNNVFGPGAFPDQPLPSYGQYQRSAPPRQIQLGIRLLF